MTSFILGILILLSGDSDVEIPRVIILMIFMCTHQSHHHYNYIPPVPK